MVRPESGTARELQLWKMWGKKHYLKLQGRAGVTHFPGGAEGSGNK